MLIAWLLIRFGLYVWGLLAPLSRTSPKHANLAFGLIAFMLANVAAFSVATQAYADIFILLSLGWALGFLLAMPVLARTQQERKQRATSRGEGGSTIPEAAAEGISAAYRSKFVPDRMLPPR
jgi:hypothetical protein